MPNRFKSTLKALACLLVSLYSYTAKSQTADISPNFTDTLLCVNGSFSVPLAIGTTPFDDTNVFRIEMSNATGSFANPVIVGYAYGSGINSPTANCTLPQQVMAGTGYRLRVVTNHPAYTSGPNNKNIRVSDLPTVTATSNSPLCEGGALNLGATSPNALPKYNWTGPNGWTATNTQNPSRPTVPGNDSGDYIVTVTSYNCTSKDTVKVLVIPKPVFWSVPFETDSFACEGQAFSISPRCNICNLSANLLDFYWEYPPNMTSSQSTINLLSTKVSNDGWFKLTVKIKGTNCSTTDSSRTLIKPLPDTPTATNNGPLCVGETLVLGGGSGTPGVSYRWEGPNGQSGNNLNVTIPNISKDEEGDWKLYAVKDGCDSKPGITEVKVGIPLVPLPISGDSLLCPGDKLQLSAQSPTTEGIEWKKLPNDSTVISINRSYGKASV
ncbi:MAG: hypothetical protein K8F30_12835, partial [Taibaiella sp.]|nr:hypothetical protein [Taibaiella sp.]